MKMTAYISKRYLTQFFLLLVLVVPSLVPSGYMVQRDAVTDLVQVTICSGVNHRQAWVDVNTGQYFSDESDIPQGAEVVQSTESQMCPLAMASAKIDSQIDIPALFFDRPSAMECCQQTFTPAGFQTPSVRAPPVFS